MRHSTASSAAIVRRFAWLLKNPAHRLLEPLAAGDSDVSAFPSMNARRLLAILMREPLGYRIVRRRGSHRTLAAPGRPRFVFAFHDRAELSGGLVRSVLVKDVGLEEQGALDLL